MNRTIKTKAIVLKRTDYGESDRILQIITPLGKLSVLAKGVRKEKSKLAGGIELLSVSDIVISKGKSDLNLLVSSRLDIFYENILKDYDRLEFSNLLVKNIIKSSENVNEDIWFDMTKEILEALNNLKIPIFIIKSWFYLRIANFNGNELNLLFDVDSNKLDYSSRYNYDIDNRGLNKNITGKLTGNHIKILRILNNRPLLTIMNVSGIDIFMPEVYSTCREHAAVYEK